MAKINIAELLPQTVDKEVTLLKDWTNPLGGALKIKGRTITVSPELYELMLIDGVIESKELKQTKKD
jgi:hypothetical protein